MKKKCAICAETKSIDDFGRAKHSSDGKNKNCKQCNRDKMKSRRRDLQWMIRSVPRHMRERFIEMHASWSAAGYPDHKKPVVVGNRLMTKIEQKNAGLYRRGFRVIKMKKGIKIESFGSMAHAMRQLRMGYIELKWLSDTGTEKNGFTYKIENE